MSRRAELRHPDRQRKRDVFVGYCRPDDVAGQFCDNLADMLMWDGAHDQRIAVRLSYVCGPRICEARNAVVREFRESAATWLLMLDADMTFDYRLASRMLEVCKDPKVKVLGALCFSGGRTWLPSPTIYAEPEEGHFERVDHYPENELCKVAGTGAACILIHRDVIEDVYREYKDQAYPWFSDVQDGRKDYGEDLVFCIRARSVGHDVYVHTGIEVGHMKMAPIFSAQYAMLRSLPFHEAQEYDKAFKRAMGAVIDDVR
jgi:hypothetical protein